MDPTTYRARDFRPFSVQLTRDGMTPLHALLNPAFPPGKGVSERIGPDRSAANVQVDWWAHRVQRAGLCGTAWSL
jgi:hypothetical protein